MHVLIEILIIVQFCEFRFEVLALIPTPPRLVASIVSILQLFSKLPLTSYTVAYRGFDRYLSYSLF